MVEIKLVQNFSQKMALLGTGNQPVDHSGLALLLHADSFTNFLSHLIKANLHFFQPVEQRLPLYTPDLSWNPQHLVCGGGGDGASW